MTKSLLDALCLAIRAMNNVPSFPTGIPDRDRPGRDLSSYDLLAMLDQVVRDHSGDISDPSDYAAIDATVAGIAHTHLGITSFEAGRYGQFNIDEIRRALTVAYHAGKFSVRPSPEFRS